MGGKMQALQDGNFSGLYKCDGGDTSFRFVGRARSNSGSYLIYLYQYSFLSIGASVRHAGQRLIVFDAQGESKGAYLGQYTLSNHYAVRVAVKGSIVRLSIPGQTNNVDFSNGPPQSIDFADAGKFFR